MNIFKKTTFTWWQIGLLKVCLLFIGIVVGVTWPWWFMGYVSWLAWAAILIAVYLAYAWAKQ